MFSLQTLPAWNNSFGEEVDGKLMLQGAEDGRRGERDGVGWSMAVSKDRGDMVLTASGDGVAFVVFGACTSM